MSQGSVEKAVRLPKARGLKEDAFNLPNIITMFRVVMIPIVMVLLQEGTPVMNYWAGWVYTVATITDAIDGWLARRRGLVSVVGKFLDPLADKLLVMCTMIFIAYQGRLPLLGVIAVILMEARELSITSLRVIAMGEGVSMPAVQGGKEKAALQMIAILCLILHGRYELDFIGFGSLSVDMNRAGTMLLYISALLSLTSGAEYVRFFVEAVDAKERRLAEAKKP
jgi:CDP-diacylglycerol---glycerol-3-phosphate 3-phosphatidyltransferase